MAIGRPRSLTSKVERVQAAARLEVLAAVVGAYHVLDRSAPDRGDAEGPEAGKTSPAERATVEARLRALEIAVDGER